MNRTDFLAALRQALSGLPDVDRANALRYYEEYFDDAGPENEARAAQDLGAPADVAQQILADYRELIAHPQGADAASGGSGARDDVPPSPQRGWRGINPWLLLLIAVFAIPIGVPVLIALLALLAGLVLTLFALLTAVVVVLVAIPLSLVLAGLGLGIISFFLWGSPASAVLTLGAGLVVLSIGVLACTAFVKLFQLFVPPIVRGLVALLRWPFTRFGGKGK